MNLKKLKKMFLFVLAISAVFTTRASLREDSSSIEAVEDENLPSPVDCPFRKTRCSIAKPRCSIAKQR
jgi:hypothetical protein